MSKLNSKIEDINKILRDGEGQDPSSVTIYQDDINYKHYFVTDAMNIVLGAEGWMLEVMDDDDYTKKTGSREMTAEMVRVRMSIFPEDMTQPTPSRETYGAMNSSKGDDGDALKGAISDAIKKCASLFGIGRDAYNGQLAARYGKAKVTEQRMGGAMAQSSQRRSMVGNSQMAKKTEPARMIAPEEPPAPMSPLTLSPAPTVPGIPLLPVGCTAFTRHLEKPGNMPGSGSVTTIDNLTESERGQIIDYLKTCKTRFDPDMATHGKKALEAFVRATGITGVSKISELPRYYLDTLGGYNWISMVTAAISFWNSYATASPLATTPPWTPEGGMNAT
jgi:hypothetical protein